jgi:hypothetical protein
MSHEVYNTCILENVSGSLNGAINATAAKLLCLLECARPRRAAALRHARLLRSHHICAVRLLRRAPKLLPLTCHVVVRFGPGFRTLFLTRTRPPLRAAASRHAIAFWTLLAPLRFLVDDTRRLVPRCVLLVNLAQRPSLGDLDCEIIMYTTAFFGSFSYFQRFIRAVENIVIFDG